MSALGLLALLLFVSALFGVVNDRTLRLPHTIGILLFALLASLVALAIDPLIPGYDLHGMFRRVLGSVDLPQSLMNFALSFLLFAGALQVDVKELWARKFSVLALALLGTLLAVVLLGGAMWLALPLLGLPVPLAWCLVMGAILAPTDPVSVVGMLRRLGLPASIQAVFAGESLFNDGVGVVLFGAAIGVATGDGSMAHAGHIARTFMVEAVGGGLLGFVLGLLALLGMRATAEGHLVLILSLALATGTFSLANALGMSGPIAVVMAGLVLASRRTPDDGPAPHGEKQHELDLFWPLVDEVLNALLFLLLGLEIVAVRTQIAELAAVLIAIPLSIAVRGLSVFLSALPLHLRGPERGRALAILTWGGLRGGISVALALGLPPSPYRPVLLAICYGVVIFTIVVQGLSVERLARRLYGSRP